MPLCRREGLLSLLHSWGNWGVGKICLGTHSVSIAPWPGLTSLLGALTCSGWFCSCLPPPFTLWLQFLLSLSLVTLQVVITEITSSHLLYVILLPVSPGKTYSLDYVTVPFCWKRACNCCSQRDNCRSSSEHHNSPLLHSCFTLLSFYCLLFLIFCLLGPCSRTKYWRIVFHLAPVLVEPFSIRAVLNCSPWLWKYHLCNLFSSPEVQSKENWKSWVFAWALGAFGS